MPYEHLILRPPHSPSVHHIWIIKSHGFNSRGPGSISEVTVRFSKSRFDFRSDGSISEVTFNFRGHVQFPRSRSISEVTVQFLSSRFNFRGHGSISEVRKSISEVEDSFHQVRNLIPVVAISVP